MKPKYLIIVEILCTILLANHLAFSQETKEVRKTVELNKNGEVNIDTYKGSIEIETWDKPQVDIYARVEADGWDRHNKEKVRDTEIRIEDSPDEVRIISDYNELKSHSSWFSGLFDENSGTLPFVHYKISMPTNARLRIKDYKSESKIVNLRSSLRMNTYKGKVVVRNLEGSADLETYKGDVRVDFAQMSADTRFETYKGNIEIALPNKAAFELDADVGRKGSLHSDFETFVKSKHRYEERYRTTINGGGPLLKISTEKGDIRLEQK